jgi:hypothetical protein
VSLTVRGATERLVQHIGAVVVGKREVTEQLFGALLVEGHVVAPIPHSPALSRRGRESLRCGRERLSPSVVDEHWLRRLSR